MTVTKDTLIGDILDTDRTTATYFMEMGMHCLGCPSARGETLEPVSYTHLLQEVLSPAHAAAGMGNGYFLSK